MNNVNNNCASNQTTATLLSFVKWSLDNDSFLSDFVQRHSLPQLAVITKGQYLGVGAPNLALPNLKPYVFIYAKQRRQKLIGQVVKLKEGKCRTLIDQKIAVPDSYSGYFEILSEDGRSVKCLESVYELAQKFPDVCVVRQSCKVYLPDVNDGELRNLYKTRTLHEGETLTLCGQFHLKKISFLRCFDETGRSVYLKMNQKCKFSVIAKKDAITGVHTVENLMSKRLPLTVKLVQGVTSPELQKTSTTSNGHLVVRLQNIIQEEEVFVYSMTKPDGQFLSVPLNAHLKLAPAVNHTLAATSPEFLQIIELCDQAMTNFYDRITPFNDHQFVYDFNVPKNSDTSNGQCHNVEPTIANESNSAIDVVIGDDDVSDDEIDQLYDYIRGLAPLPETHPHRTVAVGVPVDKPPPPPVETIPGRNRSNNSLSSPGKEHTSPSNTHARTRRVSSPQMYNECRKSAGSPDPNPVIHRSPNGTAVHIAEKRLDDIIYGNKSPMRRLSKSSDKLAEDHHRAMTNGHSHAPAAAPQHYYQRRNHGHGQLQSSRQRPLSMVLLDGVPVLAPQTCSPPPPHEFYQPRYIPPPPMHHQGYRSFVNLAVLDDSEPPPSYHSHSPPGVIDPQAPPPYFHFPPTAVRPVYSRYVPRYAGHHYAADYGL